MLSAGLAEAVALDGLIWLVLAAFLAGFVAFQGLVLRWFFFRLQGNLYHRSGRSRFWR